MSDKETINPSDEGRTVNAFKYWYETNTEKGVTSIPDYICKGLLDLYNKEKEKSKYYEEELDATIEQSVSKHKIKAKIKELEKEYKEYENTNEWEIFDETKYAYDLLKELLEGE